MIPYDYEIIRSDRKTLSMCISPGGKVIIRAPRKMPGHEILLFVMGKEKWIDRHMAKYRNREAASPFTREALKDLAASAAEDLSRRAARFAPLVGVTYNRITIRAQRTRWGSSSSLGNLNFNCLLMLAPEEVRDYVVVHELCHQKQMNHSPRFWAEVERVLPDYRRPLKWLKEEGAFLIARLDAPSP